MALRIPDQICAVLCCTDQRSTNIVSKQTLVTSVARGAANVYSPFVSVSIMISTAEPQQLAMRTLAVHVCMVCSPDDASALERVLNNLDDIKKITNYKENQAFNKPVFNQVGPGWVNLCSYTN